MAVARALLMHEPQLREVLKPMGLMSHDWRTVERKKPGQAKARKKYTWYAFLLILILFQGQALTNLAYGGLDLVLDFSAQDISSFIAC